MASQAKSNYNGLDGALMVKRRCRCVNRQCYNGQEDNHCQVPKTEIYKYNKKGQKCST